ncbi:MAG: sigma factor-like helix-turn-helix DNA-binding protein, partial [Armatimonadaceae bacterium]
GKRRTRETLSAVVPEVIAPSPVVDDATAILDDEIGKLPPAVRDAVILCELQGLSRRAAAAKLGVAEGTLSSRLAAARKTLAVRLRFRGVVLSVALAGAVVSPQLASAAVAAGTGAVLSSVVVSLADGASAMTLLNKLKLTAVAVLSLLLSAGGVGPWQANETSAAPVPKAARSEGVIVVSSFGTEKPIEIVKPDGTAVRVVKPDGWFKPWQTRVTADGKRAVCADMCPTVERKLKWWTLHAVRWLDLDADAAKPTTITEEVYCPTVTCTPDGTAAYYSHIDETKLGGAPDHGVNLPFETWAFDPATGEKTRLKLPSDHAVLDISPDGKTLLTKTTEFGTDRQEVYLTPLGTLKPEKFCDSPLAVVHTPRFSPDGKRVLWATVPAGPLNPDTTGVFVVEVATRKQTKVTLPPGTQVYHLCWSPDGTRIAFHWWEAVPSPNGGDTASRVTVCDADGSNPTVVVKREPSKPRPGGNESIRGLDWVRESPDASKGDPKARPPAKEPIEAPVPKEKPGAGLIWTHHANTNTLTAYTPDGKEAKRLKLPEGCVFDRFTPDGTRMAFIKKGDRGLTLHVGPVGDAGEGTDTGLGWESGDAFVPSPDGTRVVRVRPEKPLLGARRQHSHVLYDLGTKKETKLDLPADHQLVLWSADGKTWGVMHDNFGQDPKLPSYRWLTTPAGGKLDLKPICDTHSFNWLEPSADGKAVLGAGFKHPTDGERPVFGLHAVAGGKAEEVARMEGVVFANFRRSPDGKPLACAKYQYDPATTKLGHTEFVLLDADGKTETKLFTLKDDHQATHLVGWFPTPAPPADPKAKPPAKREPIKAPVPKEKVDRMGPPPP